MVALAFGAAGAQADPPPPPTQTFPAAGEAAPPADAIFDQWWQYDFGPALQCSGWYRASDYGGRWPTDAEWWEYRCGVQGDGTNEITAYYDYYNWDGAGAVNYGTWVTESPSDAALWSHQPACSYWFDYAAGPVFDGWFGSYDCFDGGPRPPQLDRHDPNPSDSQVGWTIQGEIGARLHCTLTSSGSTIPIKDEPCGGHGPFAVQAYGRDLSAYPDGTYTLSVVQTNIGGQTSEPATDSFTLDRSAPPANSAPTASFTSGCTDLSCGFDGGGSSDPDGTLVGHRWDFGDGATATGTTAEHDYAQPGSYTVKLTVTDDQGGTDTTSKTVTVEPSPPPPPPNAAPTAGFGVSCAGLVCSVDGGGSSDSDGTIQAFSWNFGDNSTDSSKTAQHSYAQTGSYTVTLTVTDDDGAAGTASKPIAAIGLTAHGYKIKGLQKVDLSWNGSTGASFDVYRDGQKIASIAGSSYTDKLNRTGSGSYGYKVCQTGGSICSNQAAVTF